MYAFTEHAIYLDDNGKEKDWAPNRHRVADVSEALAAITHLAAELEQPSWIGDSSRDHDCLLRERVARRWHSDPASAHSPLL